MSSSTHDMKPVCKSCFCFLMAMVLLPLPARAQWTRIVDTDKADKVDVPSPHPLSYWTADPLARDEAADFCIGCNLSGHIVTAKDYKSRCDVSPLGKLADFPVKELFCTFEGDAAVSSVNTGTQFKMILVQTGADSYREIFHLQAGSLPDHPLQPAQIIDVGNESVLSTNDSDGGNGGGCYQGYWWFDASGPHTLNFDAVQKAIADRLPNRAVFTMGCWALDLNHRRIKTWAQKADAHCRGCGGIGEVTAYFALHGAVAEPESIEVTPDRDQ